MKLIVGLGNPGRGYANNRHNAGFICLSHFARIQGIRFDKKQGRARIGIGEVANSRIIVAKPQTYMNLSGRSVSLLIKKFNINLNELEDDKEILNNNFDAIVLEFENLERVWSEENYQLLSELFNKSYDARILSIKQRLFNISSKIDNILGKHNTLVEQINKIDDTLREKDEAILLFKKYSLMTSALYPKQIIKCLYP